MVEQQPDGFAAVRNPAHPDVLRLVERFKAHNVRPYETLSILEARALLEGVIRLQGAAQPVAQVHDILIPGAAGLLPARVYHPEPARTLPIVLYFHGGGWVLGSVDIADRPCRRLSRIGNCVVVSLEYRRAPETKFPGPLADCVSAARWLSQHAGNLGRSGARILVDGRRAGPSSRTRYSIGCVAARYRGSVRSPFECRC